MLETISLVYRGTNKDAGLLLLEAINIVTRYLIGANVYNLCSSEIESKRNVALLTNWGETQ